jgi:hypothetical protein
MIHTSNLMGPGGMVHSPLPGQSPGDGEPSAPAGRPAARKSQIIEEEEDAEQIEEEIEEVEEFEEDVTAVHSESEQPVDDATQDSAQVAETGSPVSGRKPALEPAPDLESSPIPPRSSSLRSPPPKAAAAIAAVTGTSESTAQADAPSDQAVDSAGKAAAKPVTSSD